VKAEGRTVKRDVSLLEVVTTGVVLLLAMLGTLAMAHAYSLFSGQFSNDEWVTHLIASDPNLPRAWAALRAAIDNNPPTLFILFRVVQSLVGSGSETVYRCFIFGTTVLALLGIYLALRVRFSPETSLTAVLAVWAHPLVLQQTFAARYYIPLLCAAVWYAYLLGRTHQRPRSRPTILFAAFAGILVCTLHYFGVVCLALIFGAELLRRRERTARLALWLTAVPGVLALGACVPLIVAQRHALLIKTYLPRPGVGLILDYLQVLLLPGYLSAVVAVMGLIVLTAAAGLPAETDGEDEGRPFGDLSGLASLLLMPFVMIAFSVIVQGALFARYALPTLAGIAPAVAVATRRIPRTYLAALCLFFLFSSARELKHNADAQRQTEIETAKLMDVIRRYTGDAPVTFESYMPSVLVYYAQDLKPRVFLLGGDAPEYTVQEDHTPYYSAGWAGLTWQRSWATRYEALYGVPGLMSWERLRNLPRRFVVVGDDPIWQFAPSLQPYPGFRLRHVDRSLYELIPE
jgi:Dolichyl-phosphate-mannose-protein mannosyltransferase